MAASYGIRLLVAGVAIIFGFSFLAGMAALADDKKPDHSAVKPVPKDQKRHEGFVAIAQKGGVDVLFLGDSITDGWRGQAGKEIWQQHFEPLKAANFGISGDRTQHVLWRIQNGELEGIHPKVAILMIGTSAKATEERPEIYRRRAIASNASRVSGR